MSYNQYAGLCGACGQRHFGPCDIVDTTPKRNQPTDRDGNPVRHGTRDKINRLRERLSGHVETPDLKNVLKGLLDLLEDEL